MIIVIAAGSHVAGGVRRHVAAPAVQQVASSSCSATADAETSAADLPQIAPVARRHRRRRLPHAPDGRVDAAVGAGDRADPYQHVGVGHVRGARVAGAEK